MRPRLFLTTLFLLCASVAVAADPPPPPLLRGCTFTPNLNLCKPDRGDPDWDVLINADLDLLDAGIINTGGTAQVKTGSLSVGGLTVSAIPATSVLFTGTGGLVTSALDFTYTVAGGILQVQDIHVDSFNLSTTPSAGFVLTSDGSGNGTWQAAAGGGTGGWTDGGVTIYPSTLTDHVSLDSAATDEKLSVGGGVVLGVALDGTPSAGTIQWSGGHFQGYTGAAWVDLDYTAASAGGWTDGGTDITLTTSTDVLGIGAAPSGFTKVTIGTGTDFAGLAIINYNMTGAGTAPMFAGSGTWNTSGSPSLFKLDLTDTASAADARFLQFNRGGSEEFSISKTGGFTATDSASVAGNFTQTAGTTTVAAFQMATGASAGYVLTSDGAGVGTWQVTAGGSGVPSGMIALFDAACPAGWTSISGVGGVLNDRFPMGSAAYSAVPGGASTHTHSVDVVSTTSSSNGAHTHDVDPISTTSSSSGTHLHDPEVGSGTSGVGGSHSHTVSGTTSSDGDHTHVVSISIDTSSPGAVGTDFDAMTSASGSSATAGAHTHTYSTTTATASDHTHSLSWPRTANAGAHTHTVDIVSTTSTSNGAHTHTTDPASVTSGSGSSLPPYVTFVYCKKD